jgi:DNA-binding response OmpR family regulator
MPNSTILLVDDDVELLKALKKFLRKQGYTVSTAAWPAEAAELMSGGTVPFDLLITDLRMPAISGFTFVRAFRATHPQIPVIVLTAFANPPTRAAVADLGAVACLEKPVDTNLLKETISLALSRVTAPASDGH